MRLPQRSKVSERNKCSKINKHSEQYFDFGEWYHVIFLRQPPLLEAFVLNVLEKCLLCLVGCNYQ